MQGRRYEAMGILTDSIRNWNTARPFLGGRQLKSKRPKPRLPGITEDGSLDPAQFPIDPVLKQAISDDPQEFRSAVSLLRSMYNYDRKKAGMFLIGLLLTCGDNWQKRRAIAFALYDAHAVGDSKRST